MTTSTAAEKRVADQAIQQVNEPDYVGKRPLNFHPFQRAINQLPANRITELDNFLPAATILEIQAAFANQQLSSEELVTYYLARIQQRDTNQLNSVIELNPEALTIARALDIERRNGFSDGALHGIPILLKDNIATGDQMHTTAGAAAMQNAQSDRDAFIVQRLREAGAIILGKGNLSEWANFMTTKSLNGFTVVGGQTRNPNGRFDVGGSSAGSAVAVAANLVTIAIGTETAGSLVYPASQNGIVTLKPSLGLVSRDHIIPITSAMDTAGPMACNVTDLSILLTVITAQDTSDPAASAAQALHDIDFSSFLDANRVQGIRIGVVKIESESRPGDEEILEEAIRTFKLAGAEVVDVAFEEPAIDYLPVMLFGMRYELEDYLTAVSGHAEMQSLADIVAYNAADLANRSPHGQDLLEKALAEAPSREKYEALVAKNRETAVATIHKILVENEIDFILSLSNHFTHIYAPAGFPAINIPSGKRADGEPLGITLVGDFLTDAKLVQTAFAFETARNRQHP